MSKPWKLPENYEELAAIALSFDAGPEPIIWDSKAGKPSMIGFHRLKVVNRGENHWAITAEGGTANLNWYGDWEHEPSNSEKSEDFLLRCRFATAREAIEIADYYRNRVVNWFQIGKAADPDFWRKVANWAGSDDNKIFHATALAYAAHRGQFRKYVDGVPYITHPASIARQTEEWVVRTKLWLPERMVMTSGAWGHDVGEDCDPIWMERYKEFDLGVFNLITELTNPSKKRPDLRRADRKKMDREHLGHVSWMAKLIKLIDRRSNLMEIADQPAEPDFKRLYARESEALLPYLSSPETKDLEEEYMVWVRHLIDTKG
jgi:guanosine-3',5'-bis(diphosphate) 3'-pyrophosphohydrolase